MLHATTAMPTPWGGLAWPKRHNRRPRLYRLGLVSLSAYPLQCGPLHPAMPVDDAKLGEFEATAKPLWLRAQAGDEAAYRDCLGLLATRLRRYFSRRMMGAPDEVEDLVQETLLAMHVQRGTYDESSPVSAWALAIARHKLIDVWRRRGRQDSLHDAIDDVDEHLLGSAPDDGGASRDLDQLLQELPAAQRQAIMLTKIEGLSTAEAASQTGATESAIKVQVHRGLKRLAALVRTASVI
jgi:RNA polymerase sigma-70 factor, ECF subfamily